MRRIRHYVPTAKIIAAFWNFDKDAGGGVQTMGVEIVTTLKDAVDIIEAAMPGDVSPPPLPMDRRAEDQTRGR